VKISVIGLGYLGAVTAASFASLGHKVIAIDRDENKINEYIENFGGIHEPGLKELIRTNIQDGNLSFFKTEMFDEYLGDVVIVSVGTPTKFDGSTDLSQVHEAIDWILEHPINLKAIIMASTVPPGTGVEITKKIRTKKNISYYSCPEFLSEGNAVKDFIHRSRIIVGSNNNESEELVRKLHSGLKAPYVFTDTTTAEMIKLTSNVFLSTKISFINSVANLCDAVGANIDDLKQGIGLDPRIGQEHLNPGVGYGGSCLPKDTIAFTNIMNDNEVENDLIKAVTKINESQKKMPFKYLISRIKTIKGFNVSVLGLSFKANTDDIRESPAIYLIKNLVEAGVSVKAYDPFSMDKTKDTIGHGFLPKFTDSIGECVQDTSIVFVMHTWEEFDNVDWAYMNKIMRSPKIIYDGRNSLDPNLIRGHDFEYVSIGKR